MDSDGIIMLLNIFKILFPKATMEHLARHKDTSHIINI